MRRSQSIIIAIGLALVFWLPPSTLAAQDFPSLIKHVNSLAFSFSCWNARGAVDRRDCWTDAVDYGIEVTYGVTKVPFPWSRNVTIPGGWKPVRKEVTSRNGKPDSTLIYQPVEDTTSMSSYLFIELGVGYSQFSGFSSVDTSFVLKGSVREIPSLSVYGTLSSDDTTSALRRYRLRVGLRSGLIQLNNAQILDPMPDGNADTFAGTAQTFQLGGMAGFALAFNKELYPYVEYAWQFRKFPSVEWNAVESRIAPLRFPRVLDFTGPSLTVGVRVQLK
jgi:hypothetical protein